MLRTERRARIPSRPFRTRRRLPPSRSLDSGWGSRLRRLDRRGLVIKTIAALERCYVTTRPHGGDHEIPEQCGTASPASSAPVRLSKVQSVDPTDLRSIQVVPSVACDPSYQATMRLISLDESASVRACAWPGCRRGDVAVGVPPGPGGRTSASAECRQWSGKAVRWSSCAILS